MQPGSRLGAACLWPTICREPLYFSESPAAWLLSSWSKSCAWLARCCSAQTLIVKSCDRLPLPRDPWSYVVRNGLHFGSDCATVLPSPSFWSVKPSRKHPEPVLAPAPNAHPAMRCDAVHHFRPERLCLCLQFC